MKKRTFALMAGFSMILVVGCGVSQADYDSVVRERDDLQKDNELLKQVSATSVRVTDQCLRFLETDSLLQHVKSRPVPAKDVAMLRDVELSFSQQKKDLKVMLLNFKSLTVTSGDISDILDSDQMDSLESL